MDAASTRSLDTNTPSAGWGRHTCLESQFRNSEPNPSILAQHAPTAVGYAAVSGHDRRANATSLTWTSSSGDWADCSDDDVMGRHEFIQDYNRLAIKHGIRPLTPENCSPLLGGPLPGAPMSKGQKSGKPTWQHRRRSWFSRAFFRQPSPTSDASSTMSDKRVRSKRSVSDLALHLMNGARKDSLKDEDLQSLVRLCGKTRLYLPSEYSPGSLVLPTCFRATAQHLVQHGAETRGVFRIPGSVRVVNSLYNYYCADGDLDEISSTIRCPNLPPHLKAGTHDVASAFKRLLSGLPGGILGSLRLFDALVAIHSQLEGEAELTITKQTKLRARLIALAIASTGSRLRRDLICAVFGLLCLIGRAAETAPREDEYGRPLPTSDLMGYNALGIVFGPLLVGDLLKSHPLRSANAGAGSIPSAPAAPCARKEKRSSKTPENPHNSDASVSKVHVANSIAEMLITHWREVVRQMKSFGASRTGRHAPDPRERLRPSASESFTLNMPPLDIDLFNHGESSVSPSPAMERGKEQYENTNSSLVVPRRRPRTLRPMSSNPAGLAVSFLSPPAEEPSPVEHGRPNALNLVDRAERLTPGIPSGVASDEPSLVRIPLTGLCAPTVPRRRAAGSTEANRGSADTGAEKQFQTLESVENEAGYVSPLTADTGSPAASVSSIRRRNAKREMTSSRGKPRPLRLSRGDDAVRGSSSEAPKQTGRPNPAPQSRLQETQGPISGGPFARTSAEERKATLAVKPKVDIFGLGRSRLSAWRSRRRSQLSTNFGSPVPRQLRPDRTAPETVSLLELAHSRREDALLFHTRALGEGITRREGQLTDQRPSPYFDSLSTSRLSPRKGNRRGPRHRPIRDPTVPRISLETTEPLQVQDILAEVGPKDKATGSAYPATTRSASSSLLGDLAQQSPGSVSRSGPATPGSSTLRAMAAMFESAPNDSSLAAPCQDKVNGRARSKLSEILSPYTVDPSLTGPPNMSPRPLQPTPTGGRSWLKGIRDRPPLGPKETIAAEFPRRGSDSDHGEGIVIERVLGNGDTSACSHIGVSNGSQATVNVLSAIETGAPKTPRTPGLRTAGPVVGEPRGVEVVTAQNTTEVGQSALGIPRTSPQAQLSTVQHPTPATLHSGLRNPQGNASSISEDTRRTSLPRRFPLLSSTAEQEQQQQQEPNLRSFTAPVRVNPSQPSTVANSAPRGVPGTTPAALPSRLPADTHLRVGEPSRPGVADNIANHRDNSEAKTRDRNGPNGHDEPPKEDVDISRELAYLRRRLRQAEYECAMWRETAERAERRVKQLELAVSSRMGMGLPRPGTAGGVDHPLGAGAVANGRHGIGKGDAHADADDVFGSAAPVIDASGADAGAHAGAVVGATVDGCNESLSPAKTVEQHAGGDDEEVLLEECLRVMSHVMKDGQWDDA